MKKWMLIEKNSGKQVFSGTQSECMAKKDNIENGIYDKESEKHLSYPLVIDSYEEPTEDDQIRKKH